MVLFEARRFCRLSSRTGWFVLIGLIITLGCDDRPTINDVKPQTQTSLQNRGFIAFVGAAQNDPLWPILRHSAEEYAKELDSMNVRYYLPQGNSPRHQVELLKTLDDPDMRGVCIHIADAPSVDSPLERFRAQGIQIVSMVVPASSGVAIGHVGFNNHEIGEMLAEATGRALDRKGSIMLIHAGTEDLRYASRLAGFRNGMRRYTEIEIFASDDCQQSPLRARRIIRSKSERFPRLSAWITLDDWPLRQLGRQDQPLPRGMRLITFGGKPNDWPLIRDGTCSAVVAVNYNNIGTRAAEICDAAVRETPRFPQIHEAPLRIVTLANLDEYIRDWGYWSTGQFFDDNLMGETPQ
jgi:ABC-type sugar transport system substrate-binding protein